MKNYEKFMKYGGVILGIVVLAAFMFPELFMPVGITSAMALGIFTQTCGKNVSGASKLFIAEKSVISAITVTSGEISAVTGTTPFMRVDTLQDSVNWEQSWERVGLNNTVFKNKIEGNIMPPSKDTNTFLNALVDGSPCGLLALVVDGNGKCWIIGYNATDVLNRPLKLGPGMHKTGKGYNDAEGNTILLSLENECAGPALPLDSTLTAAVLAGTSTICKWS